jgi:ATP-dependent DNA ligase
MTGTIRAASPTSSPQLAALKPTSLILDGEVAVFDQELASRFEWLRHLNHGDLATPPMFMAFDLLQLTNGFAAWTEVVHRGWEGCVGKDPASPYVGGPAPEKLDHF